MCCYVYEIVCDQISWHAFFQHKAILVVSFLEAFVCLCVCHNVSGKIIGEVQYIVDPF